MVVADIGATKTVVAQALQSDGRIVLTNVQKYESKEAASFAAILEDYRGQYPFRANSSLCVGAAGPVENNVVCVTHLKWPPIDGNSLARRFGFRSALLLNDLVAAGLGLEWLPENTMVVVNGGQSSEGANWALVSPGSGLGEAIIHYVGGRYVPVASEGGHSDFAPFDGVTLRLWSFMRSRNQAVPVESVLSGPGLANLHRFYSFEMGLPLSDDFKAEVAVNPGKAVLDRAHGGSDPAAVAAVRLFIDICASETGNFALKGLAVGGVFIGGGIMPRLIDYIDKERFTEIFACKGKHEALLRRVPVKIVTDTDLPLYGAAGCLLNQSDSF